MFFRAGRAPHFASCDDARPARHDDTTGNAAGSRTISNVGFSSPETAIWDSVADIYLLSNINGSLDADDNNGFISRIKPDGTVETLKWIEGGKDGVLLHGPKAIILKGDILFAAASSSSKDVAN